MSRVEEVTPIAGQVVTTIDWWDVTYKDLSAHQQLVCPICRTALVAPYTTQCGHTFCKECIFAARKAAPGRSEDDSKPFRCPVDRELVSGELVPAPLLISSLIDELIVVCPMQSRGCTFSGKRWLLETHIADDCEFVDVSCHPPCTRQVQRRHLGDQCRCQEEEQPDAEATDETEEIVRCSGKSLGCKWRGADSDAEEHEATCVFARIHPTVEELAHELDDLRLENKAIRRQLDTATRHARREASELDAQFMSELERLWQEQTTALAAREGHAKHMMVLARENVRMTEEMTFLRSSVDSLHRQLNLALLSQRRMSFFAATSDHPEPESEERKPPQKL